MILSGIQIFLIHSGANTIIFLLSPLVFMFLLITCISNISMIWNNIRTQFNQFKQISKGKSRLLAQTFPIQSMLSLKQIAIDGMDIHGIENDKIKDQIRDLIDWIRLLRQYNVAFPGDSPYKTPTKKEKGLKIISQILVAILSGTALALVGGFLYIFFNPDIESLAALIISLFVSGTFAPTVIWKLMRK